MISLSQRLYVAIRPPYCRVNVGFPKRWMHHYHHQLIMVLYSCNPAKKPLMNLGIRKPQFLNIWSFCDSLSHDRKLKSTNGLWQFCITFLYYIRRHAPPFCSSPRPKKTTFQHQGVALRIKMSCLLLSTSAKTTFDHHSRRGALITTISMELQEK